VLTLFTNQSLDWFKLFVSGMRCWI